MGEKISLCMTPPYFHGRSWSKAVVIVVLDCCSHSLRRKHKAYQTRRQALVPYSPTVVLCYFCKHVSAQKLCMKSNSAKPDDSLPCRHASHNSVSNLKQLG